MHERTLEQTSAQIAQVEQQIYSIEAANINQETLNAMKNAGAAMKKIHGNLTIDKVDQTMDELREQHALGEEIATAISSAPIGEPIDETELEDELEGLEQEVMDERMLKTGPTPVTGEINRLPPVATGPGKFSSWEGTSGKIIVLTSCLQSRATRSKRTRKPNSESYRQKWPCNG